jgi:protoporphyrinogen oxidase
LKKSVVIIGAGPAGLTAAFELLKVSNMDVTVFEAGDDVGGISRTVNYKGNRMDIGGHRFFSKSDTVMNWWGEILPIESSEQHKFDIHYQGKSRSIESSRIGEPDNVDDVMLVRSRRSSIYFLRSLFDYPITPNFKTFCNLGLWRSLKMMFSYGITLVTPKRPETNLENFMINRFGKELYQTFFKSYTEKVWGVSCEEISAEWGAQRLKGLSIAGAIKHFVVGLVKGTDQSIQQKEVETSLIERFLYPKFGPGQLWQKVRDRVVAKGGKVKLRSRVVGLELQNNKIVSLSVEDTETGERYNCEPDYVISTMPIKELVPFLGDSLPADARRVAQGLLYRDFITVGLLLSEIKLKEANEFGEEVMLQDNWIYIQEPDVRLGRLQIFNNWSPHLVADQSTVWLGLEYFCNEGDALWSMTDEDIKSLAISELVKIDIIDANKTLDAVVVRVPKTYPAYFGAYSEFDTLQRPLDEISNLYLVGRNGMHKYNNQDHSMLTAMEAVKNIISGRTDKVNIWAVNTEMEYHESK